MGGNGETAASTANPERPAIRNTEQELALRVMLRDGGATADGASSSLAQPPRQTPGLRHPITGGVIRLGLGGFGVWWRHVLDIGGPGAFCADSGVHRDHPRDGGWG